MNAESSESDARLLLDARRGRADAAASFYKAYAPPMLAYARALLRNDAAAEDAVQQTFVQILSLPPRELEKVQDLLAWLIRATRNTALNAIRTDTRLHARETSKARLEHLNGTARPSAGSRTGHAELLTAVNTLSDEHRELILLKHVAGLTFDQIAWSLELNRNTIASRYSSALDRLRNTLSSAERVAHG